MRLDDRVVLIDKPAGITSFGAVRALRRLAGIQKVGHCGSLDPNATGLLVLCTGVATRVSSLFVDLPKEYQARVRFGRATDSYDADGSIVEEATVPPLSEESLRGALRHFEGEIEQTPPMVSALKHQGRRLYELAREGQTVERAPRRVMVFEIGLRDLGAEHADIRVRCGRGCYVRSIAHDLGRQLGVPAHLEALRRTAIGPFRVEQAVRLESLQSALRAQRGIAGERPAVPRGVTPLAVALESFPALYLRRPFEAAVRHGAQPEPRFFVDGPRSSGPHRLLSEDGRWLLAVCSAEGRLQFARVRLMRVFTEPLPAFEGEADAE
ncbi:MAG: tRNA pseudouridine(55) synthase TruB [Candidatus Krumholzibacteriia bacterium]